MIDHYDDARAQLRTVRDLLRFAVTRFEEAGLFYGHGSDNAWDEAAYLVHHALHLPLERIDAFLDARLTQAEREAVLAMLRRRVEERVPAAYLTGEAFLGPYRFRVDERVIVPRSFIGELMLDGDLAPWIDDPEAIGNVLELCTGSGCLAIVAAHVFPNAKVDAVDLSTDALEVARLNVADYGLEDTVTLYHSDLYQALPQKRYDLILSNPPYVNAPSMATLPEEYRREPEMALAGGEDGLDLVHTILREAPRFLTENGLLVVEIGHNRDDLEAAYPDTPFTWLETESGNEFVFLLPAADLPGN
ncbi:N5-glutamine S-adenosyl-L-methionine-dependent methyltransferase [Oryzomicrobium terrae]|uniref:Ribosomal protein uL3 glutamine methyltransferase n=1 Tax=Oryzomicrobium terrae TaxID=1735038 RepID=A0A5C1E9H6_9RHOO|nr:50S ribosomal protein L3 N(5)-glutamine methyltransferase [Oryzomicrobium terrae]QEL64807.1 N5-glutamine S-adenosyl-L-methionine-dependent methyltransferase [Oryzomicrobium terrae]